MKKLVILFVLAVAAISTTQAQDKMMKEDKMMKDKAMVVALEQTPGEFTQKQITLKEGTYVFEITNNNVGHDVGFVLVPKGKDISKADNHIQTAYVTKAVGNGLTESSKPTTLTKGEYYYFCPLNPTATDNVIKVE